MNICELLSNFISCDKYDKRYCIAKSVGNIEVMLLLKSFAENEKIFSEDA